MQVAIANPILQTYVFLGILLVALAVTLRKRVDVGTFGVDVTQELKGFAILAIVFSHIGYFLVTDHRFLFPISILAGVGVDIFLLLSGFGLTSSALSRDMSPLQFYRKRLSKLYVPFWIVLAILFACDFFFLHDSYGLAYVARSFLGFFPNADIYNDIDSPLWYFSWIVFFYILFPLLFSRKSPLISALGMFTIAWMVTSYPPPVLNGVFQLYQLHAIAFPLGVIVAGYMHQRNTILRVEKDYFYYPVLAILMGAIAYFAKNSGVGKWYLEAELISIATSFLVIALFVIKRHDFRFLYLFGIFSFEVYLVHWPLMYRYDILFKTFPASVAVTLYLALFLGIGWVIQRVTKKI